MLGDSNVKCRMNQICTELKAQADLLVLVRDFFANRGVMEVQTPLLRPFTVTDPNIESFFVPKIKQFLQTSPEYAMKALLAQGAGAIYQICKAFRDEEIGRYHKAEFTMLEWYRPAWDHHQLMQEVAALIQLCFGKIEINYFSYAEIIQQYLGLNFSDLTLNTLKKKCIEFKIDLHVTHNVSADDLLNLLLSTVIEPQLVDLGIVFIYDFPPTQAALSKLNQKKTLAHRFEVYVNGLECGNGFWELTCAQEQAQRFNQDNQILQQKGSAVIEPDTQLLSALKQGLPDCSGVAIGLDRLFMQCLGIQSF